MEAAADGIALGYKGLGGVATWAIVAIIALVVVWVIISVARRNRS